jgi:hypothetical protein
MHFTPTSASWLNMVERFFRDITTERLRRGVFTRVPELVAVISCSSRSRNLAGRTIRRYVKRASGCHERFLTDAL